MHASPDTAVPVLAFGVIALVWLVVIAASIAATVLWIIALIDVCKREFPGPNDKLIWILVVVLAHWIGALIYWYVGRPKGVLRA
jgi:hypothetical protein